MHTFGDTPVVVRSVSTGLGFRVWGHTRSRCKHGSSLHDCLRWPPSWPCFCECRACRTMVSLQEEGGVGRRHAWTLATEAMAMAMLTFRANFLSPQPVSMGMSAPISRAVLPGS